MRGDYVLIYKGISHLPSCILIHNPLAFELAFHEEQFTNVYLEILNRTLQFLKWNWAASFLAWISLSLTVVIPRPESVKRSVKRSSVRKLKLSTAFALSAPANNDSKLFSESSIEVLPLKLPWVINSCDSESLNIDSLILASTTNKTNN